MPRNELFPPRNNGNHSQPYPGDDLGPRVFLQVDKYKLFISFLESLTHSENAY
jgi:hypothetical protein